MPKLGNWDSLVFRSSTFKNIDDETWKWIAKGPGRDQKLVEPWYRVVQPRPEVREGRSFNPDEFAIALGASCRGNRAAGLYESRRLLRAHLRH